MRLLAIALLLSVCLAARAAAEPLDFGRYHALVVGIDQYRRLEPLKTAAHDARAVHKLLTARYGFHATLLLNPDREALVRALDGLRERLGERDNLVIYYAGHGHLDRQTDEGFWLPADAEPDSQVHWVPVSTVTRLLRATAAKHVLLIVDSCYSGTLTRDAGVALPTGAGRQAELRRLSAKRARKALTSGGLEPVNDGGGDGHSVFARALLKTLGANRQVMDGEALFRAVRRNVVLNARQTPEYADVRFAGDEGGDFLFVPAGAATPVAAPVPGAEDGFLAGPAIEAAVAGRTLRLLSPVREEMVRLAFRPGGRLDIVADAAPRRVVHKRWWVADGRVLCRTYDRDDKTACNRLKPTTAGNIRFHRPDGAFLFEAEMLAER